MFTKLHDSFYDHEVEFWTEHLYELTKNIEKRISFCILKLVEANTNFDMDIADMFVLIERDIFLLPKWYDCLRFGLRTLECCVEHRLTVAFAHLLDYSYVSDHWLSTSFN